MKTLLWCLVTLWLQTPLLAQVKQLTGLLKGPGGKPLPQASVSLRNKQGLIVQYAISNDKGSFQLSLPDTANLTSLSLEVSHLGYKRLLTPLQKGKYAYELQLEEQAVLLPEVQVKNRPVISNKGDTVSYNVRSFAQEEDRSIGDVLRRMPGIEVGDDGKIYYNGQQVSNLYIHGDDLMAGRYGLAPKVINKELIQSVDVIRNHQPVKVLQDKTTSDAVAVNLVLKDENSLALTGQAMLAGGWPKLYDAALNTIILNKSLKMINAAKSNNSGVDYQSDYEQLGSDAFSSSGGGAPPPNLLSGGTVPNPDLPRRNYYFNRSGLINLNHLVNNKKGVQFRTNVQGFSDRQTFDYSSTVEQYLAGDTIIYREKQDALRKPWFINGAFTVMANTNKYYIRNKTDVQLKGDYNSSQLQSNTLNFGQQLRSRQQTFSNDFDFKPFSKSRNMLDIHLYTSYATNPQRLFVDQGLHSEILNDSLPYAAIVQQARIPAWYNEASLGYIIPSNTRWITQEYKLGFSSEQQTLISGLELVQDNGSINSYEGDVGNDLRWRCNVLQASAKYSLNKGRFNASIFVPFTWQGIRYRQPEYALDTRDRQFFINPTGWVKYRINVEDHLQFNYRYNNNMGNISGVYRGAILTNYRSLLANDAGLQERSMANASLSYSFQRAIIMLFINAGIAYTKTTVNSLYASIVTDNIQRSILLPYENDQSSFSANAGISKYIFALKSTVSVKGTFSKGRYNQFINDQFLPYDNNTTSLQVTIESKPFGMFSLRYNGGSGWSNSRRRDLVTAAKTISNRMNRIDQNIVFGIMPLRSVFMNFTARHLHSRQPQVSIVSYLFMDLNLRYKHKPWRTDFEFDLTNIGNVNTYELYRVSSNIFSANRYQIRGRMAVLRATFNL